MTKDFYNNSYLFSANSAFVEELFEKYLQDPASVSEDWRLFFENARGQNAAQELKAVAGASWCPKTKKIIGVLSDEEIKSQAAAKEKSAKNTSDASVRANMLIRAYRTRGHFLANLDPLELEEKKSPEALNLSHLNYGFTDADLDQTIKIDGEIVGIESAKLSEIINVLKKSYSGNFGLEFMHIQNLEQKEWLQNKVESLKGASNLSKEEKKDILKDISETEGFEQFLHVKFPGAKRFSVEGGESSVLAVEHFIRESAKHGVAEIVVGMPHRGRLNVLTKIMGKPYHSMLSEFKGNLAHPEEMKISGDVKYHLGTSSDRNLEGKKVHLSLAANPSHLEAVNPVVVGKVRAKQDQMKDFKREKVTGILLHGDAAFAGQGVVPETLSLGDLAGYKTGGTFHVIVNNQIGFTAIPRNSRTGRYPTEVAKIVQSPIFHVNGDDPEMVAIVSKIAAEYRHKFQVDVVVDVFCYRKHGHNETDEPMFTQPLMYSKIAKKQSPAELYAAKLIRENVISEGEFEQIKKDFRERLDSELQKSENYKPNKADWLEGHWGGLSVAKHSDYGQEKTGVSAKILEKIGAALCEIPENFKINAKIKRQIEAKKEMLKSGKNIDWSLGEALAFGTLLAEKIAVRLSGQDSCRGTFSHRHAVLKDQETEEKFVPLNHVGENQAGFEVINSNLSEFAVLGFEYGYSLVDPNNLVIWEAQFGDFANGAQVIIDQFISSAEIKWLRMSGLVMLLPHGYEGQGPEHSSARLERYLELCAEDNMQIVNCTTPAQIFHALRRQICRKFRKPLIVMSPKSLLRHKLAISSIEEFTEKSKFQTVIGDVEIPKDAKKLVISSGKIYYDLLEAREENSKVALVRLEQFYPFPGQELANELKKHPNAEVIWCQEEPENMGAWRFLDRKLEGVLSSIDCKAKRPVYVGRKAAASPAAGYKKIHDKEQEEILKQIFKK